MAGNVPIIRLPNDNVPISPSRVYRRNSLAATLHANFIGFGSTGNTDVVGSARRRLSNVSDAVTRKFSRWRVMSISVELTVSQGSSLCAQYIRSRLKRSGIFHRKLGLKRMRSAKMLPGGAILNEVYLILTAVGSELEKMHPTLFVRIARQIGCGTFSSEQTIIEGLTDVSREMIRNGEITWSKVIALYAIAGGIAVDSVRQGKPEFIPVIQRAMTAILEEDIASWIQVNGGWSALVIRYRPTPTPTGCHVSLIVWCIIGVILLLLIIIIQMLVF